LACIYQPKIPGLSPSLLDEDQAEEPEGQNNRDIYSSDGILYKKKGLLTCEVEKNWRFQRYPISL
jgi:hypothetical protein